MAICLKIFWDAAVEMEPPHTGSSRGAAHPVWQLPGVRHVWFLGVPGLGLSPGPLSRRLLPAWFRGTVNPLNGLGGNSSSPLLNGSSDAACRALEVAELRPYSGPNHPPTPSQNNNNPSDILGQRQPLCRALRGTRRRSSSNVPLCVPRAARGQGGEGSASVYFL